MDVALSEIKFGPRSRKNLGDIAGLAASIERVGLLHPVVLTADNSLVVGARRVEAFALLGREKIPARVMRKLDDLQQLEAELAENTCREALAPVEAVELGGQIEKLAGELAKAEQRKAAGGDRKSNAAKNAKTNGKNQGRKNLPTLIQDDSKRATSIAAAAVGMSRPTYEKAKAVVASGDQALIDEMNGNGKVDPAHKKLKAKALKGFEDVLLEEEGNGKVPEEPTVADACQADNKAIESFCRSLLKFFNENIPSVPWTEYEGRIESARSNIRAACETLRAAKCDVCPACVDGLTKTGKCSFCRGVGYMPSFRARQLPPSVRR